MDIIFDSTVHPLYSVMAFLCATIALIILISNRSKYFQKNKYNIIIYLWTFFFCIQDGFWGLFASHVFYSDLGLWIASYIFHLSAITSVIFWTYYFLSTIRQFTKEWVFKFGIICSSVIALIQIVMLIINISNHFMFYVDNNHEYVTTDYRSIMFYMQFATYILFGIISLISAFKHNKNKNYKTTFVALLVATSCPVFFGIFQMIYPDAPYDSVGFAVACLMIHIFLTLDYEREVINLNELKEELNEALENAQAANKAKSSFLFNMSHDVRTPLNAILGYTQMAKKYIDNTEQATGYLEKIDISGNQLLALINQVLEMSRIESGKIVLQDQKINVDTELLISNTIYSEHALTKGIKLNINKENIIHSALIGDKDRINQIINNIIGNSIKYTPEGGSINYKISELESDNEDFTKIKFEISDTGIGISEEFLPHIFEEFAREKTSTISKIQGTGLGMSIVKELVTLMGGSINIDSKVNVGTTVTIIIDFMIDKEVKNEENTTAATNSISLKGMKVLLVEDNEMNREIAEEILTDYEAIVFTAEDGDIAVEKVENSKPGDYDLILMDIQMPRMNGYEATKAIRKLENPLLSNIPIVAITANAFEEDKKDAMEAGMNGHIAKPIDIKMLLKTLSTFKK